jgi:hypothetical protein
MQRTFPPLNQEQPLDNTPPNQELPILNQAAITPPVQDIGVETTAPLSALAEPPVIANPYDPASLPLPLPPSTFDTPAPETPQEIPEVTIEDPQLASELVQVEATEQPQNTEPAAVYHEATGELEIVHHTNNPPRPSLPPASLPQSPMGAA